MIRRLLHKLHLVNTQLIVQFDSGVKKKGIVKASKELLENLDVTVDGKMSPFKGPIVFVSNHIGGLDSHALMSLISRYDYKIIALSTYHVFGPEYSKRLFPIYRKKNWNHAFFEYPLNIRLDTTVEHLSMEEIRLKNRQTIQDAAAWVSKGGVVSIFPEGNVGKKLDGASWKVGVGHLIVQITNPETKIVFVRIDGSHKSDLFRYIRADLRKIFFRPKTLRIRLSQPVALISGITPKEIVVQLERKYKSFLAS